MSTFKSDWLDFETTQENAVPKEVKSATVEGGRLAGMLDDCEERAAIREYDGGLQRHDAERLALRDVYDTLPGQDRNAMSPEEFEAVISIFAMLMVARDSREK